jgi:hypothetical protein
MRSQIRIRPERLQESTAANSANSVDVAPPAPVTVAALVTVHDFGIEVYRPDGSFAGGMTLGRLQDGPKATAEALVCILKGLGLAVTVGEA